MSNVRPFRFGVSVGSAESAEGWRDAARKAEDLGFDTFLVADHIRQGFQPMVALAAAAEATTRIRLGTFVINNDFRHPVLLAREAATLDVLSGGRFELGIGAGHSGDEYNEAGIPFDSADVRVARLDEAVRIIKKLWGEENVTFDGTHYRITGHASFPKPVQTRIPVAIGGNGKPVLELAAREADIAGLTGFLPGVDGRAKAFPHFTAETIGNRIDVVRRAAGERFEDLELNVLVQGVDTATGAATAAQWADRVGFTAEKIIGSPFTLFGAESQLEEKLLAHRERFGISYITVFEPGMDALAPLVARLSGR
jgi:probable F420-dependent oxidoreductase